MSNINLNFQLQIQEGVNSNVVTLSRSGAVVIPLTNQLFEQINVAANAVDVQTTFPSIPSKLVTIENTGTVDITVKLNVNTGTAIVITAGRFISLCTSTAINSLFCSNADTANAGQLKVFIGG